jgi:hypothetical protein
MVLLYYGDKIKDNEIGGTCSIYVDTGKLTKHSSRRTYIGRKKKYVEGGGSWRRWYYSSLAVQ